MRYDVLLMDSDMTVFDFRAAEAAAIGEALAWAGIADPDAPEVYSRINAACWADLEKGLITQGLLRAGQQLPGAEEALRELSALVPIALVTNGIAAVQHGRIEPSPVRKYIRQVVISSEEGFFKPDPRLIDVALRRMGTTKERALMVGDSLSSDILGAQRAGVDACWLNPEGKPCALERAPEYTVQTLMEVRDILLTDK